MTAFYVETSALIKRYRTEKVTMVVNGLFDSRGLADVLLVSHLVTVEVESVAIRALNGRALDRTAYAVMLRRFAEDLVRLVVLPFTSQLFSEAAEAAREHALRALDALHFATALRLRRVVAGPLVFVASDHDLLKAAEASGLATLDPEEVDALERLEAFRKG